MNRFEASARRLVTDVTAVGVELALVGGFAVSIRAEPRFTQDLDLAVAVRDDDMAESVVRQLLACGHHVLATVEHDTHQRLATVRLELPETGDIADLLFASSGIEQEVVDASEEIEVLPGLRIAVARTGHLIALKLLARDDDSRPQDIFDLRMLLGVADDEEIDLARRGTALIEERGYDRGRDLQKALATLLSTATEDPS